MRNAKAFFADLIKKPPILFPLVALFHVLAFAYSLWSVHDVPFPAIDWLQPLWMLCFTACWLAACDLRRWGALGYILFTTINIILRFAVKSPIEQDVLTNALFPADILFSFFIMFYFRRFR